MFTEIIKKFLMAAFRPAYEGEGGAAGGDSMAAVAGDGGFVPSEAGKVEQEFLEHMAANDEEYQELLKLEKGEGGEGEGQGQEGEGDGKEGKGEEGEPPPKPQEDESLPPGKAQEGDNWIDAEGNEYTFKSDKWYDEAGKEFQAKPAEGEGAAGEGEGAEGEEGEQEEFDYPDDVIPGLKGKDFAAMPKEGQEAIARYHEENLTYRKSAKSDLAVMEALKNDPVAKHRLELIKAGRGASEYQLPEVTAEEANKILETQTPQDAIKLINKAAHKIARTVRDNERIRDDMQRRIKEANTAGEKILLEAGNLHPDLHDEKNKVDKRLKGFENCEQEGHQDKGIYDSYHQKIVDFCTRRGYKYVDIAKMKPTELYALVAVNEGWPVAFNTQKRDSKMLTEQTMKALQHFRRSKRGGEVARGMRKADDTSGKTLSNQPFKIDGIDVVKLAKDDGYHESVLNMKPGKTEWIDRVRELRHKGEEIIDRRKRKREQAEKRGSTA
jgi:hypothetical protein